MSPRHALLAVMACLLVAATSGTAAAAAPGPVVIDDFGTGAYNLTIHAARDRGMQVGSMAGGVRCTILDTTDNQYNRLNQLGLGTGKMFVETGVRVNHAMYLLYGWDKTCAGDGKMSLDLSGQDRLRIDFDLVSLDLAGMVVLWSGPDDRSGEYKSSSIAICTDGVGADVTFSCDMPFSGFDGNVDFANISYMGIVFESAGTIAAHEYAINSIRAVSAPEAPAGQQRSRSTTTKPPIPITLPTIPRPGR